MAVVQVMAFLDGEPRADYIASVLSLHGRIQSIHKDTTPLEQVLMVCEEDDPTRTVFRLPTINIVWYV